MSNTQSVNMKELAEQIDRYVSTTFKDGVYSARLSGNGSMIRVYQLNKDMGITHIIFHVMERDYNLQLISVSVDRHAHIRTQEKDCLYALFEVKQ